MMATLFVVGIFCSCCCCGHHGLWPSWSDPVYRLWIWNKFELTLDALLLADGQGDDVRLVVFELQLFDFFTGMTSVLFLARTLFRFKPFVLPCQIHTTHCLVNGQCHSWNHIRNIYLSPINRALSHLHEITQIVNNYELKVDTSPIHWCRLLPVDFNAVFALNRLSFYGQSLYSNSVLPHCHKLLSFSVLLIATVILWANKWRWRWWWAKVSPKIRWIQLVALRDAENAATLPKTSRVHGIQLNS